MPTSTNVTNLIINELTEAQYDSAVQGGTIGANEISILTDVDDKPVQVSTLPTAGADELGNIYQFVGTTDANYTNGYFYKCVSDGGNPATYSWTAVQVQAGGGSSLPSQTGNSGKFLTTDGTDASWSDKPVIDNSTDSSSLYIKQLNNSDLTKLYSVCILGRNKKDNSTVLGYNVNNGYAGIAIGYTGDIGNNADYAIKIGNDAGVSQSYGIALGQSARATAVNAIQIGSSGSLNNVVTNSDANTFKVANENGNFELMSADGTIPAARHASLPAADGTYVLKLVISGGVPTLSWVAE